MTGNIISDIGHELKTQLTSVKSLSEVLHDFADMEENRRREFTGIIIRETERLNRLTNHVLNMLNVFQSGSSGLDPIIYSVLKEGKR
jgi:signal transduction histidine kinase